MPINISHSKECQPTASKLDSLPILVPMMEKLSKREIENLCCDQWHILLLSVDKANSKGGVWVVPFALTSGQNEKVATTMMVGFASQSWVATHHLSILLAANRFLYTCLSSVFFFIFSLHNCLFTNIIEENNFNLLTSSLIAKFLY